MKEMADYNKQKQLELWNDTNYEAQKQHLQNAGLNAALLYGKGGGGGATASLATSTPTGATAQQGGGGEIGMGLQAGMMAAQQEVLKSQARLNNVEADKKAGIDTKLSESQIAVNNVNIKSITQGVENQKAQEAYTKAQTAVTNLQLAFDQKTFDDRAEAIEYYADIALENANQAKTETFIKSSTQNDVVANIKANAIGAQLANELTKAQTNVAKETINKIQSDILVNNQSIATQIQTIAQGWKKLDQSQKQLEVDTLVKAVESLYKGDNIMGTTVQIHDREGTKKAIEKILNK